MRVFFFLTCLFYFAFSPLASYGSCSNIFGGVSEGAFNLAFEIHQARHRELQNIELTLLYSTKREILRELAKKRRLRPHPGDDQVWYQTYLSLALLSDFKLEESYREAPMKIQAARLIWGSPDLISLMSQKAMRLPRNENLLLFYNSFIDEVVDNMLDRGSNLRDDLWDEQALALFRFKSMTGANEVKTIRKTLLQPGMRGFVYKFDQSDYTYIAMNLNLQQALEEYTKFEVVEFNDAGPEGLAMLASAHKVHILAHLSDRWAYRTFLADKKIVQGLYGDSPPEALRFAVEFYAEDVAVDWVPPYGVEIQSRNGAVLTLQITSPSRLIVLDSDIRIRSFAF